MLIEIIWLNVPPWHVSRLSGLETTLNDDFIQLT